MTRPSLSLLIYPKASRYGSTIPSIVSVLSLAMDPIVSTPTGPLVAIMRKIFLSIPRSPSSSILNLSQRSFATHFPSISLQSRFQANLKSCILFRILFPILGVFSPSNNLMNGRIAETHLQLVRVSLHQCCHFFVGIVLQLE